MSLAEFHEARRERRNHGEAQPVQKKEREREFERVMLGAYAGESKKKSREEAMILHKEPLIHTPPGWDGNGVHYAARTGLPFHKYGGMP